VPRLAASYFSMILEDHSRRQDDWEMYEREKETTVDEQHM